MQAEGSKIDWLCELMDGTLMSFRLEITSKDHLGALVARIRLTCRSPFASTE